MRVCGVEIKSNEAIICLLSKKDGLFDLPDCRQVRFQLVKDQDAESIRRFQFTMQKFFQDYKVEHVVIKERPQKGKFAGAAVGFKIEAALQLIESVDVSVLSGTEQKEKIKRNPMPVDFADTGLKKFQETAFHVAYAYLAYP
ncbi:DUF3010 family protein [Aliidiomarina maris]|uniref:DUF3010 domain-containing protein n=1 Tax=Aliidiomarina maris TaxID=531312 RepID=A0A327WR73_9GAMM|nr:DUF3010 family protein [Aliidiomarina maris]RAJ94891.1 Protein of unknown function (DUF3010) [Aliidiomarina maris]RUO20508.1 DUF3010 domain-containing protein [Aliidiomarina maris]